MKSKIAMIALLAASVFGGDAYAKVTTYECKMIQDIEIIDGEAVFVAEKDLRNNPVHNGYKVNLIENENGSAKFIVSSSAIGTVIARSKLMDKQEDDHVIYGYADTKDADFYAVMTSDKNSAKGKRAFTVINGGKGRAYTKCKGVK